MSIIKSAAEMRVLSEAGVTPQKVQVVLDQIQALMDHAASNGRKYISFDGWSRYSGGILDAAKAELERAGFTVSRTGCFFQISW